MYTFKKETGIRTVNDMMHYLKQLSTTEFGDSIAILGGHFMLLYDKQEDSLKPVIHQDLSEKKQKEFAELMAGDFPVRSFDFSLQLIKYFRDKKIRAGIAFIINDHKFQSSDFQPSILEKVKNRGGKLRSAFYRQAESFPVSYNNLLIKYGFKNIREVVYDNDDPKRQMKDILPKKTIYFSEQSLRNRFDKKTRTVGLENERFYEELVGENKEIFYTDGNRKFCITEKGKCGCSSEIMEFIWNLIQKGHQNIIMFIPEECESHVNNGTEMAIKMNSFENKIPIRIFVITGIGGMAETNKAIMPRIYSHSLQLNE